MNMKKDRRSQARAMHKQTQGVRYSWRMNRLGEGALKVSPSPRRGLCGRFQVDASMKAATGQ